ncbi:cell division protein ZapA [Candidatus Fermentibacterales bacterium]|nr:cell division protein ZapA [Candidatus Fermentibacterales bacterium]
MSRETPSPVRVNIYGREYAIRGEGDGNYIADIAHYVDMKMREMTDNMAVASTAKVAILAALNITDELYQKEQQLRELDEGHRGSLSRLADLIEAELEETDEESGREEASPGLPESSRSGSSSRLEKTSSPESSRKSD